MKTLSIALLFMYSCFPYHEKEKKVNYQNIQADYEIAINDSFTLKLVSNPSTGYMWKWANKNEVSVVDSVGYTFVAPITDRIGAAGYIQWTFKGIKSGVDTVEMIYCRSWETKAPAEIKKIVIRVK